MLQQGRDGGARANLIRMAVVAVGLAMAACGPAESLPPGIPTGGGAEPPKAVVASAKYADEWQDPSTAPEPSLSQAGGIPAEDLTATPKFGGTLRLGAVGSTRLDPHFDLSQGTGGWPKRIFGNGLLRWDLKTGTPQPDLAESWTVAQDGLSYDFKIRKGIRFHNLPPVNGREVTMQDIKWSFDRVSGLEPRPGKQGIFFARYSNVKEFQIIDDTTLRMVMKQPDVQILAEIMHDYQIVLAKEAGIDDSYEDAKTLIGSGPFMVEYAEPGGQYRFTRNPDYWEKDKAGRQLPYLDKIISLSSNDAAAKLAAFKARQLDWTVMEYRSATPLFGMPDVRYYSGRGMVNGAVGVFMNTTIPPFNDVRVRRAVHLALDREEFIDTQYNGPEGAYVVNHLGGWPVWQWSEDKVWSLPGYAKGEAKQKEIAEARRLLAEAGYPNGIKDLVMADAFGGEMWAVLQHQLAAAGVAVKVNKVEGSVNRYATYMKDKHMATANAGGGHVPDYAVAQYWLCSSVQNMSNYCDPEVDRLFFAERRERDTAKRIQLVDQIQQRLWDDMPMAPLARNVNVHMSYKYVRGWRNNWYDLNFSQGYQMAYVWFDK